MARPLKGGGGLLQDFEFVQEVADMLKEEDNYTQES